MPSSLYKTGAVSRIQSPMSTKRSPKISTKQFKKPMSTRRFKKLMSTRRSKKQMSSERSLTDLPSNVLVEILARLPLRTLFVAKSVCKTFSLLTTHNPHFINLHSSNAAQILVFQFGSFTFPRISSHVLRFAHKELHYKKSQLKPLFQLPKVGDHSAFYWEASCFYLANSCNGLLLFSQNRLPHFCSSLVCNPVTNEYILIPEVDTRAMSDPLRTLTNSTWLGYTPATDQYKVLRIFGWMNTPRDEVSAQVSVIGSDSWRYIDGTPLQRSDFYSNTPAALVNEVMYWHHSSWSDLFSFDFEGEKFKEVALPPEFQREHYMSIGVLGGCLCLTCNDSNGHRLDLWVMTKCGSWRKEFVVDTGDQVYGYFRPLQFIRNRKILMVLDEFGLVCYDPRSKNIRCFGLNKRLKMDYRVAALTPSFVPLRETLKVEKVLSELRPRGDDEEL